MKTVLLLPLELLRGGSGSVLFGVIILLVYALIIFVLCRLLVRLVNLTGVSQSEADALVVQKRIVAAHNEWQGRNLVKVPESRLLDLNVQGQVVTFSPPEWIYERAVENGSLTVRFRKGRFDRKIIVDVVTPA